MVSMETSTASAGRAEVQQRLALDAVAPSAVAISNKLAKRRQKLVTSIRGKINPVRPSVRYRLVTLLASAAMLLLPLIYVTIAFGIAYLAFRGVYAFSGMTQLGGGIIEWIVRRFPATVVAMVTSFFMFRPLLHRTESAEPFSLDREAEPVLFDFVDRLLPALEYLNAQHKHLFGFLNSIQRFDACLILFEGGHDCPDLGRETRRCMSAIHNGLQGAAKAYREIPFPFVDERDVTTLAAAICPPLPYKADFYGIYVAGDTLIKNYCGLYERVFARLCEISLMVETHIGLPETDWTQH